MRTTKAALLTLTGIAGLVVTVTAAALDSSAGQPSELSTISTRGAPVALSDLSVEERRFLGTLASGSIRRLGTNGPGAFYLVELANGERCFATGSATGAGPKISSIAGCPAAFPSPEQPLLSDSLVALDPLSGESRLLTLSGFAADGVAAVGIEDRAGDVSWTPVANNAYLTSNVPADAVAVLARDKSGAEIVRHSLESP